MDKAIISKWECPECGNVKETKQIFSLNAKGTKLSFEAAKGCACGRQSGFKLLSFESGTAIIKKDAEK